MRANHVKRRLSEGEPSVGTWMALPSPEAAEFVSGIGFDWLVVDTEHNAIDIRTLSDMFRAMTASPVAPMVRIPWNDPEHFKRVLDAGAWGIVVPMVNSKEEAERAVDATRYPPTGKRSVGGGRHAVSFATTAKEYYAGAEDNVLLVLQIEHIDGVNAAEEIMSVPGVDACFIGPNDLGASMGMGLGVPLESDDPGIMDAIKHVRETCIKHGVAPGIHCSDAAAVNRRIGEGFQFCAMASELKYLLGGLNEDLKQLEWEGAGRHEVETVETGEGTVVRY